MLSTEKKKREELRYELYQESFGLGDKLVKKILGRNNGKYCKHSLLNKGNLPCDLERTAVINKGKGDPKAPSS